MRSLSLILLLAVNFAFAKSPAIILLPQPKLPSKIQSGAVMEPASTQYNNKSVQEFIRNGHVYMLKITPNIGPAYYLTDSDGDGNVDSRYSGDGKADVTRQYRLLSWD